MSLAEDRHFVGKVVLKAVIVRDEKVLVTRDSRDIDTWELPGGRMNDGETPHSGLQREIVEELGVAIEVKRPVYVNAQYHGRDDADVIVIALEARLRDAEAEFVCDPREVAEHAWVTRETWRSYPLFPEYEAALEAYFAAL